MKALERQNKLGCVNGAYVLNICHLTNESKHGSEACQSCITFQLNITGMADCKDCL